jgi:hypothetical protein
MKHDTHEIYEKVRSRAMSYQAFLDVYRNWTIPRWKWLWWELSNDTAHFWRLGRREGRYFTAAGAPLIAIRRHFAHKRAVRTLHDTLTR